MIVAPVLERFATSENPAATVGIVMVCHDSGHLSLHLTDQRPAEPETPLGRVTITDLATGHDLPPAGGGGHGGIFGQPPISHARLIWNYRCEQMPSSIRLRTESGALDTSINLTPAPRPERLRFDAVEPKRLDTNGAHRLLTTRAAVGSIPERVDALDTQPIHLGTVTLVPFAVEHWTDSQRVWFQVATDDDAEHLLHDPRSDLGLLLDGRQGIRHTGQQSAGGTVLSIIYPLND